VIFYKVVLFVALARRDTILPVDGDIATIKKGRKAYTKSSKIPKG